MPNNMILLETIALTQSAASVTFDNLPTSGYTDLKIVVSGRFSSGAGFNLIDFNGLSTANFSNRVLEGTGSSAVSFVAGNTNYAGALNGSGDTANTFSNEEIYIPNYRSSNSKSISFDAVMETNGTTAYIDMGALLWANSAAITSIRLTTHTGAAYAVGSSFSLYGIAALGTTPVLAPKATGGNIVANDGTYWYHAFTSSGNFVPQIGLTADCLVIAGGGGGGDSASGGGGAGGYRLETAQALANGTNYACTIGAGGIGATGTGVTGANGSNTVFASITSTGGGGGGGDAQQAGSGGSGGGAPYNTTTTLNGAASPAGQGNAGGFGNATPTNTDFAGGGGGGASAVGSNGASGSTGGAGSNSASAWASVTNTGVSGYFAGGGGGARGSNLAAASGGAGGGGTGARRSTSNATSGIANTGGGGGGGDTFSGRGPAGNGGSGIVIVRYPIA